MISNTDPTLFVYSTQHIRVKVYTAGPGNRFSRGAGMQRVGRVRFRALRASAASALRRGQVLPLSPHYFSASGTSVLRFAPDKAGTLLHFYSSTGSACLIQGANPRDRLTAPVASRGSVSTFRKIRHLGSPDDRVALDSCRRYHTIGTRR